MASAAALSPAQPPCSSQQRWRQRAPPPLPAAARRRLYRPSLLHASIDDEPVLSEDEPLSSADDVPSSSSSGPDGGSMRRDAWRVPIPPHLHGKAPRKHWNANALAFLGDSVWEVSARETEGSRHQHAYVGPPCLSCAANLRLHAPTACLPLPHTTPPLFSCTRGGASSTHPRGKTATSHWSLSMCEQRRRWVGQAVWRRCTWRSAILHGARQPRQPWQL